MEAIGAAHAFAHFRMASLRPAHLLSSIRVAALRVSALRIASGTSDGRAEAGGVEAKNTKFNIVSAACSARIKMMSVFSMMASLHN